MKSPLAGIENDVQLIAMYVAALATSAPVSYTHLDVYKRQTEFRWQ